MSAPRETPAQPEPLSPSRPAPPFLAGAHDVEFGRRSRRQRAAVAQERRHQFEERGRAAARHDGRAALGAAPVRPPRGLDHCGLCGRCGLAPHMINTEYPSWMGLQGTVSGVVLLVWRLADTLIVQPLGLFARAVELAKWPDLKERVASMCQGREYVGFLPYF